MSKKIFPLAALGVALTGMGTLSADDANVSITPLGSHDGEFCVRDRALVLEDPGGTRILYDAGRTVLGPDDPRLGRIDVVLLSHVHADHLGDAHQQEPNAGSCEKPVFSVKLTPSSNTINIVKAKEATFLVGGEMARFFARRLEAVGGDPSQVRGLRYGGLHQIGGVSIASVPAVHSNGLDPVFLDGPHGDALRENGLTAYVGPPGGYVIEFSNGLVVYLSGDTGITAEQDRVVRGFYKASLAVINIGGTFTTGPTEAAHVINELVKPRAVIASHANEKATEAGKLLRGTRTDTFAKAVHVPVYVPLSGKTMEFDGGGQCVSGC